MREINIDSILALNIPNLRPIIKSGTIVGARGQTLSAQNKRWILAKLKATGIDTVIDLRAGDCSVTFHAACEEAGLEYLHFPIDKFRTPDAEIIRNLPALIDVVNSGRFYISCALGLHRTDIALSLCYIFDPNAQEPPILYGHIREGKLRCDDIFQRAGSVYRNLTAEDKNRLGWDESLDREYIDRKKLLQRHNEDVILISD